MDKLVKVVVNDFRLVFRDSSLNFFFIFPILNLLVVRYGFPYLVGTFSILENYVSILMMFLANQGALIFGFIYSMVLIDEKDTYVSKVYGVMPISRFWFVIFRLIPPFLLSTLATILIFLVEPYFNIPLYVNIFYSIISGMIAPIMVLFIAIIAKNKLEGMTWQKLFNIPVSLPILAFFIPPSFSYIFAFLPTFWAYQGFNNLLMGDSYLLNLIIGFLFNICLVIFLAQKFTIKHFE